MKEAKEHQVCCRIKGTVQGVGYRGWTQRTAQRLGLRGWVMNQADGSVCALFVGAPETIKEMLSACWDGPRAARVASVSERAVQEGDEAPPGRGFEVRF